MDLVRKPYIGLLVPQHLGDRSSMLSHLEVVEDVIQAYPTLKDELV